MTALSRAKQLRRFVEPSIMRIRGMLTPAAWRRIWRLLTLTSVALLAVGTFYAWRRFPIDTAHIAPSYLLLAMGIYVVTYSMHMLGWHSLATLFFGRLPLRSNMEGVASSTLLKYLPTIAWYIANRAHFYHQRDIPRKHVVAAAMAELGIMIASGGVLYGLYWLSRASLWLGGLAGLAVALLLFSVVRWGQHWRGWAPGWLAAHLPRSDKERGGRLGWLAPVAWYGATWPLGVCFLWAILRTFVPLQPSDLIPLFNIWLLAGLTGYIVSTTLGTLGVTRDLTITFLLAQIWPLSAAIATSILVRILLNLGEIGCSAVVLGWLHLTRKRAACD
jgi:hypothetical protein